MTNETCSAYAYQCMTYAVSTIELWDLDIFVQNYDSPVRMDSWIWACRLTARFERLIAMISYLVSPRARSWKSRFFLPVHTSSVYKNHAHLRGHSCSRTHSPLGCRKNPALHTQTGAPSEQVSGQGRFLVDQGSKICSEVQSLSHSWHLDTISFRLHLTPETGHGTVL